MQPASLQQVADELEILRLLARLAQSVDDRDEDAYSACLADEVMEPSRVAGEEGQWRAVPNRDYARRSVDAVSDMDWTQHRLCNCLVTLDGDHASAKADMVVDMEATDEAGVRELLTIGGRYDVEFVRLPQGWRITKRNLTRRYVIGDLEMIARAQARRQSKGEGPNKT